MPTYKLPAEKKRKKDSNTPETAGGLDEWDRTINIPVNDAILKAIATGDEVEVTLHGEITETSKQDSPDYKRMRIGVKISSVEVYSNENAKAEKEFNSGYKKGMKSKE